MKKYKVLINGIQRDFGVFDEKTISNKLKQKWIGSVIDNTDEIAILIYPTSYIDNWQTGSWSIEHQKNNTIITCTSCDGSKNIYDLNELIKEKLEKIFNQGFELIMCPYCGARLNRVGKNNILPTSCHECNHERFEPIIKKVIDKSQLYRKLRKEDSV